MEPTTPANATPTRREALAFWLKLGFISFGGPAGQIATMHEEVVERKKWVSEEQFLHALNYCMLLPGPEAQQLATYLGWLLHRTWGGIVAGTLFVLPSAFILWGLSWLYMAHGQVSWVSALFYGTQPAVLAIVTAASIRIGKKTLRTPLHIFITIAAFAGLASGKIPFIAVIAGSALLGWLANRGEKTSAPHPAAGRIPLRRRLTPLLTGLALWWLPILLVGLVFGFGSIYFHQGLFFSKVALITFGGAYAVLPYVAQEATQLGWLSTQQIMAGLGLAESTPGPLVMVLQFIGFVAAWQNPAGLPPLAAATLASAVTTWATFLPSFLFIFIGAPYVETMRNIPALKHALSAVTAAVVGIIAHLAFWFAVHLVHPSPDTWTFDSLSIAIVLLIPILWKNWPAALIVVLGLFIGLARWALGI